MFDDLFKGYKELTAETLSTSCFMNDGKGNFKQVELPEEMQQAPVFSFASIPNHHNDNDYIGIGNFYGVLPYEGRYDALYPTIFSYQNRSFKYQSLLPDIKGEMRDAKWLKYKDGQKLLVLAGNNQALTFLKENK